MKSVGAMIAQLAALVGTRDLSDWERQFVVHTHDLTMGGIATGRLSGKQVEKVQEIYDRHFGDAEVA